VVLVWSGGPLPIVTMPHVHRTGWFWIGAGTVYQSLPKSRSGLAPAARRLYQTRPPRRGLGIIDCYNALELVTGGAVDEGDAVPVSIGQHTGTGREVPGRLAWHFDRVCDLTGRLATGHQVLVGLW
jgi:hypothetical protein